MTGKSKVGLFAICWLRNVIYASALVLVAPWVAVRSFTKGRKQAGWKQKLLGLARDELSGPPAELNRSLPGPDSSPPGKANSGGAGPTIWLHGVSVGEILLLQTLVKQLRDRLPCSRIFVSTTTTTGMALAKQCMPPTCSAFYFPLDFTWAVKRSLASTRPDLIVLGELELWPNFLAICEAKEIPVVVVNARLSEASFAGYRRLLPIVRPMFQSIAHVAAQNEAYAKRFIACGTPDHRVEVTGSIKFDNVCFDRQSPAICKLQHLCGLDTPSTGYRVFVAGSTQIEEEQLALNAFARLWPAWPTMKLIVVPRHPNRSDEVERIANSLAIGGRPIRLLRRSKLTQPVVADSWDVLLVDCVGELSHWWGVAEIALVGGTFGSRG